MRASIPAVFAGAVLAGCFTPAASAPDGFASGPDSGDRPDASEPTDSGTSSDASATHDSGKDFDRDAGVADADAATAPDATFGLDSRPSNTTCLSPARPPAVGPASTLVAFANLTFAMPILPLQAPGDASRWFLVQKTGAVKVFPNSAATPASSVATFIDITADVSSGPYEAGLLGMAFHPSWATNFTAFLSYTAYAPGSPSGLKSTLARYRSNDLGKTLDAATREVLFTLDQPYANHNGGHIAFGPDGYLYFGLGDGGSGGDPQNHAQDINSLLGKMLRIDVNGPSPYAIPQTNPFARGGGKPEIFAWGLRNPWRFSFDRGTGELWAGDVGQGTLEEIDKIELGGNYGWRIREGNVCHNPPTCSHHGLIDPVVVYGRTEGVSVTGGYVYRGSAMPELVGKYVYGDFGSGRIWTIDYDRAGKAKPALLVDTPFAISTFGEGLDGELLIADYGTGRLHRLAPAGPPQPSTFPRTLSATGCVSAQDPTKPSPGLIPYDVNAPLWSDGASKERWLALPDGARIHINPDGDWDLPIGSVTLKTFRIGGKRIETRLFVRHQDGGWAGYSYEWNAAGTDAALLPAGKTAAVGGQTWIFPGRAECLQCHSQAAGRTLGLETSQLNREYTYATTGRTANQLATLEKIGLFDAALPGPVSTLARYPDPLGPGATDQRARAYLHANCSFCHRPQGTGGGTADLRFSTRLPQASICNVAPEHGNLGAANPMLVLPGNPARSVLSLRMKALTSNRMPPLSTRLVDASGTALIDAWITGLASCQ